MLYLYGSEFQSRQRVGLKVRSQIAYELAAVTERDRLLRRQIQCPQRSIGRFVPGAVHCVELSRCTQIRTAGAIAESGIQVGLAVDEIIIPGVEVLDVRG